MGVDWIKAKVDTGARSSSLHAFDLELFDKDDVPWVRFSIQPKQKSKKNVTVETPLLDTRSVKSSSGVSEVRPVIHTTLALGGVSRTIELTLTRRDEMGFRMLVGREALRGDFTVDPGSSFLTGTPPTIGERDPFEIGGVRLAAGTRTQMELPIALLPSGTHMALPLLVVHGRKPGPTVWINAAIHGDEIGGVEVVRRVMQQLDADTMSGTLIAVPIVNVHGFVSGDRYLPDRRDLNRSFPGAQKGSLAARIAHLLLTQVVSRCSVGIDLHTGSNGRTNLPQIRADLDDPKTAELADVFGAPVVIHARPREGSLRSAGTKAGAVVLVYEGGEAFRFDRAPVLTGTAGVLRVLGHLNMIDEAPAPALATQTSRSTKWARARRSGLTQLDCSLGDEVSKGDVLGRVHDSFGTQLSQCRSPIDGIVIGLRVEPLVNRGDALVHIASPIPKDPQ